MLIPLLYIYAGIFSDSFLKALIFGIIGFAMLVPPAMMFFESQSYRWKDFARISYKTPIHLLVIFLILII